MSEGPVRLRILVVDDEPAMREVLEMRLSSWGAEVFVSGDAVDAERIAARERPDVVISDVVLPGVSGMELLRRLKVGDPSRPVVLITAHGTIDAAVEAMKLGANDFLTKPLDHDKLRATLDVLAELIAERREGEHVSEAGETGVGGIVGVSESMREIYRLIEVVARADAGVIVTGETGTGKEIVARAIHDLSPRARGPFIAVNLAAVPESLVESELFGHEKGAFTGASAARPGCFELADGGTLFIDEVTEMPEAVQPKLLRVLEEGRTRRVGGAREIRFDVRVIAATNRDPFEAIEEGRLRQDLYYRLNVFTLALPALRDRGGDAILLARHFIRVFSEKHALRVEGIDGEARRLLERYRWPGNVRELRNVIERSVILARSGLITATHLPPYLRTDAASSGGDGIVIPADSSAAEAERILILSTLERLGNNKAEAARQLGIDVKTIRNKLKRWDEEGHTP